MKEATGIHGESNRPVESQR